jgi:hypothetical protein
MMIIDCERCEVRGNACHDCVVGVFLGVPGVGNLPIDGPNLPSGARAVQLDAPECQALDVLAEQGLVPRLRLVASVPTPVSPIPSSKNGFSNAG